ncbi:MAG: hypothetical protein GX600_00405 [Dehalococcoidia bacterium]|nr:hypothetical protein [Dehalococcoidia bacterium]
MWVVVALSILIALTALALSIPVDLGVRAEVHGKPVFHFRLEWPFGRVGKTFRSGSGGPASPKASAEKKAKEKTKAGRTGRTAGANARLVWDVVHVPGLWRSIVRLLRRLRGCIGIRTLSADFRAGLGDPADTAMYVGPVSQAAMFAGLWSPWSLRLVPTFEAEPVIEGEGRLSVRIIPISLVPPVIAFLCAPSTLRTLVLLVRSRWKRGD